MHVAVGLVGARGSAG